MKKIIFVLLLALGIVAVMSNATYEQQSITDELNYLLKNEPMKDILSQIELTFWGSTISVDNWGYVHFVELLIRKATHFFGYGLVGVILWLLYLNTKWRFPRVLAILSVAVIASLDEFRQSFIPSRTGAVEDVVLDVAGAITLICIAHWIRCVKHRRTT